MVNGMVFSNRLQLPVPKAGNADCLKNKTTILRLS